MAAAGGVGEVRELSMKKLFSAVLLCVLFAGISACEKTPIVETATLLTSNPDATMEEISTEATEKSNTLGHSTTVISSEDAPYSKFFEEAFGSHSIHMDTQCYTLYDIDGNGTKELLLGANDGKQLYEIYTIQNGDAVCQEQFRALPESSLSFSLFDNGLIKMGYQGEFDNGVKYFRFKNGELKFQSLLYYDFMMYLNIHYFRRDAGDEQEREITKEEFEQMQKEIEGDSQVVELDWRPLAEWGQ